MPTGMVRYTIMIARPSTMPGKTIGSEAKLSSSQRPGSRVFTTIQQITEVTSMMTVALATASSRLFQTERNRFVLDDGAVRIERQPRERFHRRHGVKLLQRRPEQDHERQD